MSRWRKRERLLAVADSDDMLPALRRLTGHGWWVGRYRRSCGCRGKFSPTFGQRVRAARFLLIRVFIRFGLCLHWEKSTYRTLCLFSLRIEPALGAGAGGLRHVHIMCRNVENTKKYDIDHSSPPSTPYQLHWLLAGGLRKAGIALQVSPTSSYTISSCSFSSLLLSTSNSFL